VLIESATLQYLHVERQAQYFDLIGAADKNSFQPHDLGSLRIRIACQLIYDELASSLFVVLCADWRALAHFRRRNDHKNDL
jgi:hypothetical protein